MLLVFLIFTNNSYCIYYTVKSKSNNLKNSKIIRIITGMLFVLFSFVFLYFIQGELLSVAQCVYSKGVTSYSILAGAIIITLILCIIQWLTRLILQFKDSYYSLSYFPSCMLLATLTSMNRDTLINFTFGNVLIIIPILLFVYVLVVIMLWNIKYEQNPNNQHTKTVPIWTNCMLLLMMFLSVGSFSNNEDVFTYELKTERLIIDEDYIRAAKIGNSSLRSSRKLTELRMYALAKDGTLSDRMFDYPQYYGSNGLLDISDTLTRYYRFNSKDICESIGYRPSQNMSTFDYLNLLYFKSDSLRLNIMTKSDTLNSKIDSLKTIDYKLVKDYYVAYLLLEKRIDEFVSLIDTMNVTVLPKTYGEALVLSMEIACDSTAHSCQNSYNTSLFCDDFLSKIDSVTISQRIEYKELKDNIVDEVERMNKLRRKFGKTYWWYFDYSDFTENPTY